MNLTGTNKTLRRQLVSLIASGKPSPPGSPEGDLTENNPPRLELAVTDVIVSHDEVNSQHGTGVLIQKLFRGCPSLSTIRSVDTYGGEQAFGQAAFRLPYSGMSRTAIFEAVIDWLGSATIRRVVCVPYAEDDLLAAIAVKEISDAPLCIYIMDDQNITEGLIPDGLMREAMSKARLRLAISPEMQYAYQNKYRQKIWLLPPLVTHDLVRTDPLPVAHDGPGKAPRGAIVGNIWSQKWLTLLCETLRPLGVQVDWYCNSSSSWLQVDCNALRRSGINLLPGLPEEQLAQLLPRYAFALVPSGTLDGNDHKHHVARLSLPSRIPFVMATSHTPIIVTGNPITAAARFVKRFRIGACSKYDSTDFQRVLAEVTSPDAQKTLRENARRVAAAFSDSGAPGWLWDALDRGEPADSKFEDLMPVQPGDFLYHVDPPIPHGLCQDFHAVYQALRRLKDGGYSPDFVVDVGASDGIWSESVNSLFPAARFILAEALASQYERAGKRNAANRFANFELAEIAISNKPGKASLHVSSDLYNSSLLHVGEAGKLAKTISIDVTTLDELAISRKIAGRGILKVNVQFAEHLVIEGGRNLIANQIDAIVLELTLQRAIPEAKTFDEMIVLMSHLGFRYFDDAGEWRDPRTGLLEQKDVLFVRCGLLEL